MEAVEQVHPAGEVEVAKVGEVGDRVRRVIRWWRLSCVRVCDIVDIVSTRLFGFVLSMLKKFVNYY